MTVTVAVDCGGADLGPAEVAAGAAIAAAQGVRVVLYGSAAEIGAVADGVEVIDAPVSVAKEADPVAPAARQDSGGGLIGGLKDAIFGSTGPRGGKHEGLAESAARSAVRSVGSAVGREIIRGVLGSLLGGGRRR